MAMEPSGIRRGATLSCLIAIGLTLTLFLLISDRIVFGFSPSRCNINHSETNSTHYQPNNCKEQQQREILTVFPPPISIFALCGLCNVHDDTIEMASYAKKHKNETPLKITDLTLFGDIKNGDLICLPDSQIHYFISNILPNITSYFSLLSYSGADRAFISRLHDQKVILYQLIPSKYLLKWFAVNPDGKYDKFEAIPLGIDMNAGKHYGDAYLNFMEIYKLMGINKLWQYPKPSLVEQNIDCRIRNKVYVGPTLNA
eukprot:62852_1